MTGDAPDPPLSPTRELCARGFATSKRHQANIFAEGTPCTGEGTRSAAMVAAVPSEQIHTANAAGELVALDPADLAWNRSDTRFWFHYTDPDAALAIAAGGIYEVGDYHPKAPGLYVTTSREPG